MSTKPTRLRPSQGGRFREVRPPPELVAQIRATEDTPRAIFFKGWDLEPPKAPALPAMFKVPAPGAPTPPAFDWFCAQTWPRPGYRVPGEPETFLYWAANNGLFTDAADGTAILTPKGRDLWEHSRKAPDHGLPTAIQMPPGYVSALADFNAWVDVCTNGAQWEIDYVLAVQWPRASGSNIGQAGEPLGLAVLDGCADARYHLTDRGRAALAAGRAHYAPDKVG